MVIFHDFYAARKFLYLLAFSNTLFASNHCTNSAYFPENQFVNKRILVAVGSNERLL